MPDPPATVTRTRLTAVTFVPEIRLHQADERTGLWDTIGGAYRSDRPPPFWAFAWAGGQGLARYLLDHPDTVAGLRVLDLATGGGLVAIAAARAGAVAVRAVDVAGDAVRAVARNATANEVTVDAVRGDVHDPGLFDRVARDADVVLVGDGFYSRATADRMLAFLRRAGRGGARALVGDPGREFLQQRLFHLRAAYDVPTRPALEGVPVKRTTIWELDTATGRR